MLLRREESRGTAAKTKLHHDHVRQELPSRHTLLTLQQHKEKRRALTLRENAVSRASSAEPLPDITGPQIKNPQGPPSIPRRSKPDEVTVTYKRPTAGAPASQPYRAKGFGVVSTYASARNTNRSNQRLRLANKASKAAIRNPTVWGRYTDGGGVSNSPTVSNKVKLLPPKREPTLVSSKPKEESSKMERVKTNNDYNYKGRSVTSCTHQIEPAVGEGNVGGRGREEKKKQRPPPIFCPSPSAFAVGKAIAAAGAKAESRKEFNSPSSIAFSEASSQLSSIVSEFDSGSVTSDWIRSEQNSPCAMSPAAREEEMESHVQVVAAQRPTAAPASAARRSTRQRTPPFGPQPASRARRLFERPRPRPAVESSECDEEGAIVAAALALGAGDGGKSSQAQREQQRKADVLLKAGVARLAGDRLAKFETSNRAAPSTLPNAARTTIQQSSAHGPRRNSSRKHETVADQQQQSLNYWAPWRTCAPPSPALPAPVRPRYSEPAPVVSRGGNELFISSATSAVTSTAAMSPISSPVTEARLILVSGRSSDGADETDDASATAEGGHGHGEGGRNTWQFLAGREGSYPPAASSERENPSARRKEESTLAGRPLLRASYDSATASCIGVAGENASSTVETPTAAAAASAVNVLDSAAASCISVIAPTPERPSSRTGILEERCAKEDLTDEGELPVDRHAVEVQPIVDEGLSTDVVKANAAGSDEAQPVGEEHGERSVESAREASVGYTEGHEVESDDSDDEEVWMWSPDDVDIVLDESDDEEAIVEIDTVVVVAHKATTGAGAADVDEELVDGKSGSATRFSADSDSDCDSERRQSLIGCDEDTDEGETLFDTHWEDFSSTNEDSTLYYNKTAGSSTVVPVFTVLNAVSEPMSVAREEKLKNGKLTEGGAHEESPPEVEDVVEVEIARDVVVEYGGNQVGVAEDAVAELEDAEIGEPELETTEEAVCKPALETVDEQDSEEEHETVVPVVVDGSGIDEEDGELEEANNNADEDSARPEHHADEDAELCKDSGDETATVSILTPSESSSTSASVPQSSCAAAYAPETAVTNELETSHGGASHTEIKKNAESSRGEPVSIGLTTFMGQRYPVGGEPYGDSDAESEYTPEEALEVLRKAAMRYAASGGRRESVLSSGSMRSSFASGLAAAASRRSSVVENTAAAEGSEDVGAGVSAVENYDSRAVHGVEKGASGSSARIMEELEGAEVYAFVPAEDAEVVIKMERSFKKACRVLGISTSEFFDTILESSLGDVDELSACDAAAAVAAATAGIVTPRHKVVVPPFQSRKDDLRPMYKPLKLANVNIKTANPAGSSAYCKSPATPPTTPITPRPTLFTPGTSDNCNNNDNSNSKTSAIGPGSRLWRRLHTPARTRGERAVKTAKPTVTGDNQAQLAMPGSNAAEAARVVTTTTTPARSVTVKRRGTKVTNSNNSNIRNGLRNGPSRRRRSSKGGLKLAAVKVKINAVVPARNFAEEAEEEMRNKEQSSDGSAERSSAAGTGKNSTPTPTPGSSPTSQDDREHREEVLGRETVRTADGFISATPGSSPTSQDDREHREEVLERETVRTADGFISEPERDPEVDEIDGGDFLTSPTQLVDTAVGKKMLVSRGVTMENAEVVGAELLLVKGQFQGTADVAALNVEREASVRGDVTADIATIAGIFDGKMECKKLLVVRHGGRCSGTVSYRDIRVEPGATLDAEVFLLAHGPSSSTTANSEPAPPSPVQTDNTIELSNPSWSEAEEEHDGTGSSKKGVLGNGPAKKSGLGDAVAAKKASSSSIKENATEQPTNAEGDLPAVDHTISVVVEETKSQAAETVANNDMTPTIIAAPATVVITTTKAALEEAFGSSASSVLDAINAEAAFEARSSFGRKPSARSAVRARRQWSQRAAAITAPDVPSSPTPTGLLRKQRETNPAFSESAQQEPPAGTERTAAEWQPLLQLQSPTGLSAAVAAMEEKQRAVEAERKEIELREEETAALNVSSGVPWQDGSLSAAGSEAWTIRTNELPGGQDSNPLLSPAGAAAGANSYPSPTRSGARGLYISSSTVDTPAASATNPFAFPLPSPTSPRVSKRFSRRPLPPGVTVTSPRRCAGVVNALNGKSHEAAAASGVSRSRRFTVTESAALVEEGKKALLAARQAKRELKEKQAKMAAAWQPVPAGGKKNINKNSNQETTTAVLPASPVQSIGSSPARSRSIRSDRSANSVLLSPVSRLPSEKLLMGELPKSPAGLAPRHVSPAPSVRTAGRGGVGAFGKSSFQTPTRVRDGRRRQLTGQEGGDVESYGKESTTKLGEFSAFFMQLVSSSSSRSRSPGANRSPDRSDRSSGVRRGSTPSPSKKIALAKYASKRTSVRAAVAPMGTDTCGDEYQQRSKEFSKKQHKQRRKSVGVTSSRKEGAEIKLGKRNGKKKVKASEAGGPLIRQGRFRRGNDTEESGECMGRAVERGGGGVVGDSGGVGVGNAGGGGGLTSGLHVVGDALAARTMRARRKVSSGAEMGSL